MRYYCTYCILVCTAGTLLTEGDLCMDSTLFIVVLVEKIWGIPNCSQSSQNLKQGNVASASACEITHLLVLRVR